MKITKENLAAAFALASRAAATSSPIDILKCARLVAKDGAFTLACNDLKIYAEARGECGPGDLEAVIRVDRLASALVTAGENIDLTIKNQMVTWKSGGARYQMATLPVQDFPEPKRSGKPIVTLEDPEIVDNLKRASLGCATRDIRDWTFGVLIECVKGKEPTYVGTDGARMIWLTGTIKATADVEAIIHRESVGHMADGAERMKLYADSAEIEYPNGVIIARLISAKFPDWRRATAPNKAFKARVTVNRKALQGAIKAALPFDDAGAIRFAMAGGALRIEADGKVGEKAEVKVEAEGSGDVDAWFYSAAISPTIQAARGEEIVLAFDGANGPSAYIEDGALRCTCAGMRR